MRRAAKLGKGRDVKINKMSGLHGGEVGNRENEMRLVYMVVVVVGRNRYEIAVAAHVGDDVWG